MAGSSSANIAPDYLHDPSCHCQGSVIYPHELDPTRNRSQPRFRRSCDEAVWIPTGYSHRADADGDNLERQGLSTDHVWPTYVSPYQFCFTT